MSSLTGFEIKKNVAVLNSVSKTGTKQISATDHSFLITVLFYVIKASHVKTPDSLDSQWFNFKGVTSWIKYSELFFRPCRLLCCRGGVFFLAWEWGGGGVCK